MGDSAYRWTCRQEDQNPVLIPLGITLGVLGSVGINVGNNVQALGTELL